IMPTITITATQLKNALGHYLEEAQKGKEFIISKDGIEIAHRGPNSANKINLLNSFVGIASGVDEKKSKEERLSMK
ncbi:MAG: type II toxin-antitoxin system prevent-host-death family antitoxin, partial [Bacilli bacterium]